jgi:hypothetical protein
MKVIWLSKTFRLLALSTVIFAFTGHVYGVDLDDVASAFFSSEYTIQEIEHQNSGEYKLYLLNDLIANTTFSSRVLFIVVSEECNIFLSLQINEDFIFSGNQLLADLSTSPGAFFGWGIEISIDNNGEFFGINLRYYSDSGERVSGLNPLLIDWTSLLFNFERIDPSEY